MMPLYDYKCRVCGDERTDVLASVNDEALWCPSCHQNTMMRIQVNRGASVALQFVGGGWTASTPKENER